MAKKAFEAPRPSVFAFYPDQLRIIGGADLADERERGPLDTSAKDTWKKDEDGKPITWAKHPLYNRARLAQLLKRGFIQTIDAAGVITPPSIVKLDGVPTIEVGRGRTRGCRVVNYERKQRCGMLGKTDEQAADKCAKEHLPLYMLTCVPRKAIDDISLLNHMGIENHARQDDDVEATIEQAAKLLDAHNNNYDLVGTMLCVDGHTIRAWMKFHEVATPEVKALVKAGRIGITAAAHLARKADPAEQNKLLAELLTAEPTVRRASNLARKDKGAGANPFARKKELVKFQEIVKEEGGRSAFIEGVLAFLELQLTGKTEDQRLAALFKKLDG